MRKIALIVPNNIWVSPYLSIYTRMFDAWGVEYDIISWDREGRNEEGIQFQYKEKSRNQLFVLWSYMKYAHFLKKIIKKNDYEKLVVFTPQVAIFLSSFLKKHFKNRYIFDYRDLSLEQKPVFSTIIRRVLSNSYANVISSPGFVAFLPKGFNYIISHNLNTELAKKALTDEVYSFPKDTIKILTIGALRKDMNIEVLDALGNEKGVQLSFVGKGIDASLLENYAKEKKFVNVVFTGYYRKEDEPNIIQEHTLINIVYPLIPSHISALSNRFYNSLIYKRPMIVTRNTVQGDFAYKYGVGLVIDNCEKLKAQIDAYLSNLDYDKYKQQCNLLLSTFLKDNELFENSIYAFVSYTLS